MYNRRQIVNHLIVTSRAESPTQEPQCRLFVLASVDLDPQNDKASCQGRTYQSPSEINLTAPLSSRRRLPKRCTSSLKRLTADATLSNHCGLNSSLYPESYGLNGSV